jgi:hypothetical protein
MRLDHLGKLAGGLAAQRRRTDAGQLLEPPAFPVRRNSRLDSLALLQVLPNPLGSIRVDDGRRSECIGPAGELVVRESRKRVPRQVCVLRLVVEALNEVLADQSHQSQREHDVGLARPLGEQGERRCGPGSASFAPR